MSREASRVWREERMFFFGVLDGVKDVFSPPLDSFLKIEFKLEGYNWITMMIEGYPTGFDEVSKRRVSEPNLLKSEGWFGDWTPRVQDNGSVVRAGSWESILD